MKIETRILWTLLGMSLLVALMGALAVNRQRAAAMVGATKEAQDVARVVSFLFMSDSNNPSAASAEEIVARLHKAQGRDVVVVNSNQLILADAVPSNIGKYFTEDEGDEIGATLKDRQVRTFIEISQDYPAGIKQIVVPIENESGQVMGAVILEYTPLYNELMQLTRSTIRQVVLAGFGGGAIALLIAFYMGRSIVRPLQQLTDMATGFGSGRTDLPMPPPRKDEIGELATAFNNMVQKRQRAEDELRGLRDELEVRVVERTAELAKANEALQEENTERKRTEDQLRVQATALDAAANSILITDHNGTIQSVNPAFTTLTGYTAQEVVGQNPRILKGGKQDKAFYRNLWQAISSGQVWNGELTNRRKDGSLYVEEMTITPLRNADGVITRFIAVKQDVTGRKRAEEALQERTRLAALEVEVGTALTRGGTLAEMLRLCSEAIVRHLDGAFARIWTLNEREKMLELQASAGRYTQLNGPHGRVPVGKFKIGLIAEERKSHLTNQVVGDPRVGDQEWAKREGMIAFAGYPMLVEDRLVGVVAMFARQPLTEVTLTALASIANNIALGIEHKLGESVLRESEEKFRQLAANVADVFYMTSPDMQEMHYVSPAYEQIWGRTTESLYANPHQWAEAILPEERERVFAAFSRLSADESSVSAEFPIARPDGTVRWILSRGFQVRDVVGKVIRITGIASDITQRKRAEWQLNIQHAISRVLAESSTLKQASAGILQTVCEYLNWDVGEFWNVDHRAGVMRFDDMWIAPNVQADEFMELCRKMTFARGVGLPGRVWESGRPAWVPDVVVDANFPRMADAKKAGLHAAFSVPILAGNEVVGVIEFFSHEVREPDEELLRMFVVLGSQLGQFFERKRLEEHLIQSQRMETVGKLAGGVAHEFNSILTAIIGQSELLLGDLPAGSPLAKNATEITKAAERAATLTRQLLAYGRKQFLQPETLDLNRVIAGMEGMFHHLMGGGVDTQIIPAPGLHAVRADAGQIEQVIMNMAINAREAMPNGGKLTLETASVSFDPESVGRYPELKPGGYVMLAITDTGTGMSAEVQAHVFEPFFSTKGVGQGTGLGLSTCYGIVKQSGGHISVYSELARGATFKIYLPQVEPQTKIPTQRLDSPELPRGTETILLAEDDPALREMAATLLKRLGYTVLTAANGVEALSLNHQRDTGHIDLLFTDVVMPHMSGKELADRVRALYPHTRILFTSAYTENAIVHQGVLNLGVALLQKPFTPSALALKVRKVLDEPGAPEPDSAQKTSGFTESSAEGTIPGN